MTKPILCGERSGLRYSMKAKREVLLSLFLYTVITHIVEKSAQRSSRVEGLDEDVEMSSSLHACVTNRV